MGFGMTRGRERRRDRHKPGGAQRYGGDAIGFDISAGSEVTTFRASEIFS